MKGALGSAIIIFSYGIILFLLVRPGSQGPGFVSAISSGIQGVIKAGTGGGKWSKG